MAIEDPTFRVTRDGISAPTYVEILEYFKEKARGIFGDDINLDEDTQDGQLLAIIASALHGVNSEAVGVYNAYNPATAQGVALDEAVKTNGIIRRSATYSQVDVKIVGRYGTTIRSGYVIDTLNQRWDLPESVTIPFSGEITVTATSHEEGDIQAAAHSVTTIGTPTYGWQTVDNPEAATVGVSVETDKELRERQTESTMKASVSLWEAILSAVSNIDDVQSVSGVKNDTSEADSDGVPAHSVAIVVEGGDATEIAKTIFMKKSEGVGTHGSTSVTYIDAFGFSSVVKFSRPTYVSIKAALRIDPDSTYTDAVPEILKERFVDYFNELKIGNDVEYQRLFANILKSDDGEIDTTFKLTSLTIGKSDGAQGTSTIPIEWNELAKITKDDVTIEVSS